MNKPVRFLIAVVVSWVAGRAVAAETAPAVSAEQAQFFEAKIRPIFVSACYKCHSAEQGKAKGKLALDSREGLLTGGENGPVVTPGDPLKSRLIEAVGYQNPDLQMPPKGEKLSDKEIAALTEWVKMGAPDPRTAASTPKLTGLTDKARSHWAYQPISHPQVPEVQQKAWVKTPVDQFILQKLEQAGMKPSAPATKEALLRRATYDLIGLPPTPEEIKAFVSDSSPAAFEKVINRLLASPRYGERWGRFWLDSARYSDTTGAEKNNQKEDYRYAHAWTYRDYVIHAFNSDKPYDQFIKEQIAADLLPTAQSDPSSLAALGFITVGKRFQNPNDTIDERIDTLTKSTMALTVACARCHDHKFDPIPTADYYSLHGVFNSIVEPAEQPLIGAAPSGADYNDYKKKLAELNAKNQDLYYRIIQEEGTEFRRKASAYLLVAAYTKNRSDQLLSRGKIIEENKLDRDVYQQLRLRPKDEAIFGPLMKFAELSTEQFEARKQSLLGEIGTGKVGRKQLNPLVVEAFKNVKPDDIKSLKDVADVYGKLFAGLDTQAKAYIQASRVADGKPITGFDSALVDLIEIPARIRPAGELTPDEMKQAAREIPQQNNKQYQRFFFAAINELELTHPGAPARAMMVADARIPRNSPIFIRGEAQNRGKVVPREFLEILSGKDRKPFTQGSGRLELAQAIASKDNPLTARVMINRIWLRHFGEAFVRTPDDLGVQSEAPSHPELLDYLANRFIEEGWSIKKMHKLIMLSAAYQQSSDTNAAYAQKDPENRLVWRANVRRLDFEAVRDSLLQFTGKIDFKLGGKPVNLTDEPYSNRRSVYGYIDRGSVPELMQQFDFADPDMANSKRATTIVPQQALFFMNSAMSADVARKVTTRPEFVNASDDAGRVRAIYQVIFQRQPRPEEIRLAAEFYNAKVISDRQDGVKGVTAPSPLSAAKQAERQKKREAMLAAAKLNRKGNGKGGIQNEGEKVDRRPLSVWEEYAQALLFSNEIVFVN